MSVDLYNRKPPLLICDNLKLVQKTFNVLKNFFHKQGFKDEEMSVLESMNLYSFNSSLASLVLAISYALQGHERIGLILPNINFKGRKLY